MKLSKRVSRLSESTTLKLNAQAVALAESGRKIYNLTAGQLPSRPPSNFINLVRSELDFVKSFHYTPVKGLSTLCKTIVSHHEKSRGISLEDKFDCIITNGGKHALTNVMSALVDDEDEVVILSPYWTSYPEMVLFCGGNPKVVDACSYEMFIPKISDIRNAMSDKTKVIFINSPHNPSGISYSQEWMDQFAELMREFPHVAIISDEIYYQLSYFDPGPVYYYQKHRDLLDRTIIIDGISKTLASTGLRIGWAIAPKEIVAAMTKLQGQTASGANSLIQSALTHLDFATTDTFLEPIKKHLRANYKIVQAAYQKYGISHLSYRPTSAFYYLFDFSRMPVMKKYAQSEGDSADYSFEFCEGALDKYGLAMAPGGAFGVKNCARISLVLESEPFAEAIEKLFLFACSEENAPR